MLESGPLSDSTNVDPIEEAALLAQSCHFLRSHNLVEYMGGLRKRGTWGFREVGGDDSTEEQKGLRRLTKEEFRSVEKL